MRLDKENTMHPKLRSILVLAFGVFIGVAPVAFAASGTAGPLPSATVVAPEGTTTTYYIRDMHGHMLTVEVPPLASPDVRVSNPVEGTVAATVMAVDGQTNQVKVRTQEGQTLVLNLPPETISGMRVGDLFMLSIAQRSRQ
jgi:hypothetical protein